MHHEASEDGLVRAAGENAGQALVIAGKPPMPKAESPGEVALALSEPSTIRTAFVHSPRPKIWVRAWEGISAHRPVLYLCFILLVVLASYAHVLRTRSIFACPAGDYSAERYLAYCNGEDYADYEHGAFYFDMDPSVPRFVRDADVLFLGNSRLQFAFSTPATADWFAALPTRYYLLGFLYFENEFFEEKLLKRIQPRAKVYVINMDNFFDPSESPPVKTILHDTTARNQYAVKGLWQRIHKSICGTLSALCGDSYVVFRSRETGAYYREGVVPHMKSAPVTYDRSIDQDVVIRNTANAMDFLSHFARGKCVILTMVPFVGTKIGDADAIATRLGMKLVMPRMLDGLQTFDGVHLDRASAQRWSQAFFQAAGPKIRSCLKGQGVAYLVRSTPSVAAH